MQGSWRFTVLNAGVTFTIERSSMFMTRWMFLPSSSYCNWHTKWLWSQVFQALWRQQIPLGSTNCPKKIMHFPRYKVTCQRTTEFSIMLDCFLEIFLEHIFVLLCWSAAKVNTPLPLWSLRPRQHAVLSASAMSWWNTIWLLVWRTNPVVCAGQPVLAAD